MNTLVLTNEETRALIVSTIRSCNVFKSSRQTG